MAANFVATINRVVRMSRRMLLETGHEPSAEELAERLALPLERVRRLMAFAGLPIGFEADGPA